MANEKVKHMLQLATISITHIDVMWCKTERFIPGTGVPANWHSNLAVPPSLTLWLINSTTNDGADLAAGN